MVAQRMWIDRQAVEEELSRVFDRATIRALVNVLDRVAARTVEAARADTDVLRETMQELAQAQVRTEARLEELAQAQARTEARLEELAQAQARTEARLERLEAAVEQLAQAQARTEARLEELAQAQARTEARMEQLAQAQARTDAQLQNLVLVVGKMQIDLGELKGWALESRYRERAAAYFGRWLRRVRVVPVAEIAEELESRLSLEEYEDLLRADLLLSGRPRQPADAAPIWLVAEVSAVVDRHDVERALRRAALLRQAGYRAMPLVAGTEVTAGAREIAREQHVPLAQDGEMSYWDQALANILAD